MTISDTELQQALEGMILSASGWRKIFAPGGDEDSSSQPSPADRLLALAMGLAWGSWLKKRLVLEKATVLVATDTRPTGPVLAEMLCRGLESENCRVLYVGAASAPEAMARCAGDEEIRGFAYVSASHNPVGHNGVKFGIGGGVIGGSDAKSLIDDYRALISSEGIARRLGDIARRGISPVDEERFSPEKDIFSPGDGHHQAEDGNSSPGKGHRQTKDDSSSPGDGNLLAEDVTPRAADEKEKARCLEMYQHFLEEIAGGPGNGHSRRKTLSALRTALAAKPVRIIADLNGSARCVSADRSYLEGLGVKLDSFNDEAGRIAHAILPEGASLDACRQALERAHAEDPNTLIGYVPDNDGDRGNLVIWDESIPGARMLEAQEVFALSTLAEFACAAWGDAAWGENAEAGGRAPGDAFSGKSALVVNGATSHRVRLIAAAYAAEVHEAEVGEANVVNRAAELRTRGYRVRLLGEGSNGGTITHPAEVRDPMNTITALLKLLRLPSRPGSPAPFDDWCRRIGQPEAGRPDFGPADIVATLPRFTTTPTSEARALASITTGSQGELKSAWEEIFRRQWSVHKKALKEAYGFTDWYEVNNEGTSSRRGVGDARRPGAKTGGLKVVFLDEEGADAGFLWMRGSGTEPVFRVMAEIRGDNREAEKALALWQGGMVAAADRLVCRENIEESAIPKPV